LFILTYRSIDTNTDGNTSAKKYSQTKTRTQTSQPTNKQTNNKEVRGSAWKDRSGSFYTYDELSTKGPVEVGRAVAELTHIHLGDETATVEHNGDLVRLKCAKHPITD
jgi:hypothetical protein